MTTQAEYLAAAITRALEGHQAPEKAPRTAEQPGGVPEATPGAARLAEVRS